MTAELEKFVSGAGPLKVLLLHGCGSAPQPFARLGAMIAEAIDGCEATTLALAGYGSTTDEPTAPILEQHLNVIARALDEGVRHPDTTGWHLVGHSMGGFLALLTALRAPHSVASLSLIEPTALGVLDPVQDQDALAEDRAVVAAFSAARDSEQGLTRFIEAWGQTPWASLPDAVRAQLWQAEPQIHAEVSAVSFDTTPLSAYAGVQAPVLLLAGEQSLLPARRVAERLATLPAARPVQWIPGARHMDVTRDPQAYAPAIIEHINHAQI